MLHPTRYSKYSLYQVPFHADKNSHHAGAASDNSHVDSEVGEKAGSTTPTKVETDLAESRSVPYEPARNTPSGTSNTRGYQAEGEPWRAHISLLSLSSQTIPFEKDTNPYQRCLSRGLRRVIAIPDGKRSILQECGQSCVFRGA